MGHMLWCDSSIRGPLPQSFRGSSTVQEPCKSSDKDGKHPPLRQGCWASGSMERFSARPTAFLQSPPWHPCTHPYSNTLPPQGNEFVFSSATPPGTSWGTVALFAHQHTKSPAQTPIPFGHWSTHRVSGKVPGPGRGRAFCWPPRLTPRRESPGKSWVRTALLQLERNEGDHSAVPQWHPAGEPLPLPVCLEHGPPDL